MSDTDKDELIKMQKQVIGILFEVIKRLQANNDLNDEYFQIVSSEKKTNEKKKRLNDIIRERTENAKIAGRLLDQLQI